MKTILVLNGPNINLLGRREPAVYGSQTIGDVERLCREACERHGYALDFRQSNHEGVLIDWVQQAGIDEAEGRLAGTVFNAGAYTHTSIALHDAIRGAELSIVELHISNVHAREPFRHQSWLSPVAAGVIFGFGVAGYMLAIEAIVMRERVA